jgi:hypothetical protein
MTILHTAILLVLWSVSAYAGAWVQPEGAVFVSLKTLVTTTDRFFDENGNIHQRGGWFTKYEVNPYLEYGLTERDTVSVNILAQRLTDSATDAATTGLADLELGWRRSLWRSDTTILSAQLTAFIPTGYSLEDSPNLGYDRLGLEPSLWVGRGFRLGERNGYLEAQTGLRWYAGYPSEQLRAQATGSYDLFPWLSPFATLELHYGLGNGKDREEGGQTIVADYRLLKGILGAVIPVTERLRLTAAWQQHLWGENTGLDGGAYVGVWVLF